MDTNQGWHIRLAEHAAWQIHGTPWEALCLDKGIDPLDGPVSKVLLHSDPRVSPRSRARLATSVDLELDAYVVDLTIKYGLTNQEAILIRHILSGLPVPRTRRSAARHRPSMGGTPEGIRQAWRRLVRKVRAQWIP